MMENAAKNARIIRARIILFGLSKSNRKLLSFLILLLALLTLLVFFLPKHVNDVNSFLYNTSLPHNSKTNTSSLPDQAICFASPWWGCIDDEVSSTGTLFLTHAYEMSKQGLPVRAIFLPLHQKDKLDHRPLTCGDNEAFKAIRHLLVQEPSVVANYPNLGQTSPILHPSMYLLDYMLNYPTACRSLVVPGKQGIGAYLSLARKSQLPLAKNTRLFVLGMELTAEKYINDTTTGRLDFNALLATAAERISLSSADVVLGETAYDAKNIIKASTKQKKSFTRNSPLEHLITHINEKHLTFAPALSLSYLLARTRRKITLNSDDLSFIASKYTVKPKHEILQISPLPLAPILSSSSSPSSPAKWIGDTTLPHLRDSTSNPATDPKTIVYIGNKSGGAGWNFFLRIIDNITYQAPTNLLVMVLKESIVQEDNASLGRMYDTMKSFMSSKNIRSIKFALIPNFEQLLAELHFISHHYPNVIVSLYGGTLYGNTLLTYLRAGGNYPILLPDTEEYIDICSSWTTDTSYSPLSNFPQWKKSFATQYGIYFTNHRDTSDWITLFSSIISTGLSPLSHQLFLDNQPRSMPKQRRDLTEYLTAEWEERKETKADPLVDLLSNEFTLPPVTIVITICDRIKFLAAALYSLGRQSYPSELLKIKVYISCPTKTSCDDIKKEEKHTEELLQFIEDIHERSYHDQSILTQYSSLTFGDDAIKRAFALQQQRAHEQILKDIETNYNGMQEAIRTGKGEGLWSLPLLSSLSLQTTVVDGKVQVKKVPKTEKINVECMVSDTKKKSIGGARMEAIESLKKNEGGIPHSLVFFLDDDDEVEINTIANLVRAHILNPHISIFTSFADIVFESAEKLERSQRVRPFDIRTGRPNENNSGGALPVLRNDALPNYQVPLVRWPFLGDSPETGMFFNTIGPSNILVNVDHPFWKYAGGYSDVAEASCEDWELGAKANFADALMLVPTRGIFYRKVIDKSGKIKGSMLSDPIMGSLDGKSCRRRVHRGLVHVGAMDNANASIAESLMSVLPYDPIPKW